MRGAPTRKSCDMCGWGFKWVEATQDFGQAPSNGTATSDQSARQSDKDVTPQCYLVLGVLAAFPNGLIREEICQKADIVNQAACARLNTLQERGLVTVDGEKRVAGTKRLQQVYKLARAAA